MIMSFFDSLGKLVLIFFIILLSIWLIFRIFGKYILRALIKRFSRRMGGSFQQYGSSSSGDQKNQTTIAYDPGPSSSKKDRDGEYIDYEEID